MHFLLRNTHPEWHTLLEHCLETMDVNYLKNLQEHNDYLPARENLLAAFASPLKSTHYILLGESPYPRAASANGYAFWDAAVDSLWSSTGLSKAVNRATSLRNWVKMLLLARGELDGDFSQPAIASIDKTLLMPTAEAFFKGLIQKGFLLLNATPVYSPGKVHYHARMWRPFIDKLFVELNTCRPDIQLVLFGRIATQVATSGLPVGLQCEHPYNVSFITNADALAFFKPLNLLGIPHE